MSRCKLSRHLTRILPGLALGWLCIQAEAAAASNQVSTITRPSRVNAPKANRAAAVDFNRDIRPIFSENCYACHGPDPNKRKAGLRLDQKEGALAVLKSGNRAIVPHDVSKSSLIARITTSDDD